MAKFQLAYTLLTSIKDQAWLLSQNEAVFTIRGAGWQILLKIN